MCKPRGQPSQGRKFLPLLNGCLLELGGPPDQPQDVLVDDGLVAQELAER